MKLFSTGLATLLLCAASSAWADLESAHQALAWGDYDVALRQFVELADAGDAEAQMQLGNLYREGTGVDRNAETAVQWYRQAAEHGHAEAQYRLGSMHLTGEGVFKDDVWAINWYRKAAQQGHQQAQQDLAAIYEKNGLTSPDWSQAAVAATQTVEVQTPEEWEQIDAPTAAPASDEEAAIESAKSHGIAVEYEPATDDAAAVADGAVIADSEEIEEQRPSTRAPEAAETVAEATAPSEPETEAQRSGVRGWFGKLFKKDAEETPASAASAETAVAAADPAPMEEGPAAGEDDDFPFGRAPPTKAGDIDAAKSALIEGDYEEAVRQLTPTARGGNSEAQTLLGALYQTGQGVEQNLSIAASLYSAAAQSGDPEAQFNLANMFLLGEGVVPDDERARYWYAQAAAQGHEGAQRNLSSLTRDADTAETTVQAYPADAPAREYETLSGCARTPRATRR